jgi:hypothetical protein
MEQAFSRAPDVARHFAKGYYQSTLRSVYGKVPMRVRLANWQELICEQTGCFLFTRGF